MSAMADVLRQEFADIDVRDHGKFVLLIAKGITAQVAQEHSGYSLKVVSLECEGGLDCDTKLIADHTGLDESAVIRLPRPHFTKSEL